MGKETYYLFITCDLKTKIRENKSSHLRQWKNTNNSIEVAKNVLPFVLSKLVPHIQPKYAQWYYDYLIDFVKVLFNFFTTFDWGPFVLKQYTEMGKENNNIDFDKFWDQNGKRIKDYVKDKITKSNTDKYQNLINDTNFFHTIFKFATTVFKLLYGYGSYINMFSNFFGPFSFLLFLLTTTNKTFAKDVVHIYHDPQKILHIVTEYLRDSGTIVSFYEKDMKLFIVSRFFDKNISKNTKNTKDTKDRRVITEKIKDFLHFFPPNFNIISVFKRDYQDYILSIYPEIYINNPLDKDSKIAEYAKIASQRYKSLHPDSFRSYFRDNFANVTGYNYIKRNFGMPNLFATPTLSPIKSKSYIFVFNVISNEVKQFIQSQPNLKIKEESQVEFFVTNVNPFTNELDSFLKFIKESKNKNKTQEKIQGVYDSDETKLNANSLHKNKTNQHQNICTLYKVYPFEPNGCSKSKFQRPIEDKIILEKIKQYEL